MARSFAAVTAQPKLSPFAKWLSFASTVLIMLCGGTLYLFGAYSSELRTTLGFSQTEINLIASAGGFGLYLAGPMVGSAVDKYGARIVTLISSLFLWLGYSCMAWSLSESLPLRNFVFVSFYYFLVGLGSCGCYNAAMKTNVQNFEPKDHGFAVGVSVSAFGLSALVFSTASRAFVGVTDSSAIPKLDAVGFLWFMGLITGIINFVAGWVGLPKHVATSMTAGEGRAVSDGADRYDAQDSSLDDDDATLDG
eukprot:jgi/Hompol1/176/HPOL_001009-RA